ncbi:protein kinase domain-containing protein [Verrucomicrobiota bacterium sgz303538]
MPEPVIFDHYQVLTRDDGSLYELGRGAMGITYKAFDTNLRVPVALKVINTTTLNSDVARQRFVREARSAAKLRHRHVASVFHLGAGGDTYFYAMEYIDGETVEALIRRQGPLSPFIALRIALQVARALNAAQQHGLVHRDIKPSNLMLVKEDEELVVKVIDFGLAKTSTPGEEDAALSFGGFVGTPHFASPEQLEDREIDVRSDIYSLGVTLWYMLAGYTPFSGSMAMVMSQHLTTQPPFEKLERLPEPVSALLRKMLAKDPAERHQTPSELRQELEDCLSSIATGSPAAAAEAAVEEENFATLLDNSQLRSGGSSFEADSVIADRYDVTRALGDSNTGRLFLAQDRERDCPVRLHVLRSELTEDKALYTQLEREVDRVAAVQHPNLLRVYGLETIPEASFLVLEATDGFSLMELLRARRELPVEEVLPLLLQIGQGVDFAVSSGLRRLDLALHQIHIHFPGGGSVGNLLRESVTRWPAFEVKISPLGITRELAASETWAGGETLISGSASTGRLGAADTRSSYIKAFATIAYELLGGTLLPSGISGGTAGRYSPLAPLSEGGNEIVRQAMRTGDYPQASDFAAALRTAEASETRRREIPSLAKTAAPQAPSAVTSPSASTPTERERIPLGFIGGVLTMMALAGVLYVFMRSDARSSKEPAQANGIPVASATPKAVLPAATPSPAPEPPQAPPSEPTRQDLLKAAVAGAEALEEGADWRRAIAAWLRVAKEYPESGTGRARLEMLLETLRKRPEGLNDAELEQIKPLLTEAAQLDILAAMMLLAESHRDRDPKTAFDWYSAAAAKGSAPALTQLGLMLSNGAGTERPDLPKAVQCFELAAEQGEAGAKAALGECYLLGKGVEKDEKRAIELLREASDQGNVRAMDQLGTCYHQGNAVKKDYAEALRLFSKAAEQGYPSAMGNLGVLYMNGDGVPPNPQKAVALFEKGGKLEDAYCMLQFARCLESGAGVPQNALLAQSWYKKAAEAGHPRAIDWCRKNGVPFKPKQP